LQARIVYRWPLKPPVAADREIATLNILSGERPLVSVPLKSAQAVEVGTLRQRAWDAVIELLFFWI
jgi:D-alanyl-D-alanine carboxypeptidase (penicillin-binding protein 5/6)